jgi:hypothetical protein
MPMKPSELGDVSCCWYGELNGKAGESWFCRNGSPPAASGWARSRGPRLLYKGAIIQTCAVRKDEEGWQPVISIQAAAGVTDLLQIVLDELCPTKADDKRRSIEAAKRLVDSNGHLASKLNGRKPT